MSVTDNGDTFVVFEMILVLVLRQYESKVRTTIKSQKNAAGWMILGGWMARTRDFHTEVEDLSSL